MRERIQKIHDASMKMLERTGMKYHHPKAIQILKDHGIRVEGNVAYFTEEQLMYWVRKAPSSFKLYARNPEHDIIVGGDHVNPAPLYGCAHIADAKGVKRQATMADYVNYVKLFQANEDYHVDGGLMIQPYDVPVPSSCLSMFYATLTHSDKVMFCVSAEEKYMEAMMKAAEVAYGGKEEMIAHPRMITIVNANTPLQLDVTMTEALIAFASYGQAVIIAPCDMAGTTSPMTLAGTIAMSTAEALATIALAQMIRPGTPVVMGSQSTVSDMKSGQIAIGAPEGAICYEYLGHMTKFYQLPSRTGGAITDAKIVDAQAGMESLMTFKTCCDQGINFIVHSAGMLDGYAYTSYEKVISDFEIVRYCLRRLKGFDINDDTIPLDLIDEVGHDGEFLTAEHTYRYYQNEALAPRLCSRGNVSDPSCQYSLNIEKEYNRMMKLYEEKAPVCDPDMLEKIKDIFVEYDVDRETLEMIEGL